MSQARRDPVLFLHGQPGGARDWDRVVAAIGPRAATVAIDRPGWRPGSAPTDLAGNAAAALEALDGAGASRATVVGHSLGGAVAAWLAAEHPDRVHRLVLAAPAANCAALVPLDYWLAWPLAGELVGAPVMAGAGLVLAASGVRRRVANLLEVEEPYLAATARGLRTPAAWRAFAADQRTLVRDLPALEARLTRIAVPTTIVAGSADRIVPVASARSLQAAIPGAELVVLAGAGHLLTQRQAGELAEIILATTNGAAVPGG
jgi:pimeloyl-ACP methyl ester carboxylesterase